MATINLLSSKIYNRIAAGEVVERPYSVVKELIENSIDAGAKHITVEIANGGNTLIKVIDDGCGIEKSQLKKALMPHATSKISKIDDLDNITSLGFRGEALASIASVSKMTIISKPINQELGAMIYSEGGEDGEITDYPSPTGTEISVKNLFFNTPAREKFLKSERAEESEIASIVSKFILSNDGLSFVFISDGKTVYQSFGDSFESAMIRIYGKEIIENCFYIDTEKNGIKIKGYIGKHHFTKPNRTYQSLFINGRYVVNQTVSSAVMNAYSSYLMKRQYPFYVLKITLPPDTLDVNVHPNKIDVRFSNNQIVYGSVYSVISKVLDGSGEALNIVVEKNKENNSNFNIDYGKHNNMIPKKTGQEKITFSDSRIIYPEIKKQPPSFFNFEDKKEENEKSVDIFAENKAYLERLEAIKQSKNIEPEQEKIKIERDLNYVGQVLNTYLIFDDGLDVYFIDQHAAHERVLFDKFMSNIKSNVFDVQPLLVPYAEKVSNAEFEFLSSKLKVLNDMGIEISEFGYSTFKISALPIFLAEMNVKSFFDEILVDLNELREITVENLLKEKIAQKACKSAIKSGDFMSDEDIKILMKELKMDFGLKCPHGRPIAVKISRTEMDKWFKRIV